MAHQILHTRDKSICGICGTPVDWTLRHPHPATMDHIIRKSPRGSTHTWANLRLAHRQCNLERNQFEVEPDVARDKLREAICRYTHWETYLGVRVKEAAVTVDRLEQELKATGPQTFPQLSGNGQQGTPLPRRRRCPLELDVGSGSVVASFSGGRCRAGW